MKNLTIDKILKAVKLKGYDVFEADDKPFNINLIGIRSSDMTPNIFNDILCVCWRHEGNWSGMIMSCTTDPGLYWLNNPMNDKGTAILKPGQYKGAYKLGTHKGYTALQQKGDLTVYRDADRDSQLDINGNEDTGIFGVNIHRANEKNESVRIDKWSAGCQVVDDPDNFNMLMSIVEKSVENFSNSFTYTLINESDLS